MTEAGRLAQLLHLRDRTPKRLQARFPGRELTVWGLQGR